MNIGLLCKWWWKLEHENGIWEDIVRAKYLYNSIVGTVKPQKMVPPSGQTYWKLKVYIWEDEDVT